MQLIRAGLVLAAQLALGAGFRHKRDAAARGAPAADYSGFVVLRADPQSPEQKEALSEEAFQHADIKVDKWNDVTIMFAGEVVGKAKEYLDAAGISYETTISDVQAVIQETTPKEEGGMVAFQELCTGGIPDANGTACCNIMCGSCGGAGCSQRPGGGPECCTSAFTSTCTTPEQTRCIIPPPGGFLGDYHRFDAITSWIEETAAANAAASLIQMGRTHEGRMVKGLKINLSGGAKRPIIFLLCGQHAREWVSIAACMVVADKLVRGEGGSAAAAFEWHIVPVGNADGYEYTWTRDRMWRTTRKQISSQCTGVDPNRNWDFRHCQETIERRCGESYCGPEPFSEVEVVNVANYLQGLQSSGFDVKAFLDIHAFSQFWMWPWGYQTGKADDSAEMARCGNAAAASLAQLYGTRFRTGSIAETIYQVGGGSVDWVYAKMGIKYSYAVELRDTGRYGFLLPARQIIPTGEELMAGVVALAQCIPK